MSGDLLLDPDALDYMLDRAPETLRSGPLLGKRLRLRLELSPIDGPQWLGLLAVCAWLRGGIIGNERTADDVILPPRWPYPEKRLVGGVVVAGPDPWEQYKEWRKEAGDAAWQAGAPQSGEVRYMRGTSGEPVVVPRGEEPWGRGEA